MAGLTAVGLSVLGMAFHTVREFGTSGLSSLNTGMIPVTSVQGFLFVVWWLSPRARVVTGIGLVLTGVFQLIGGAIISISPLSFLPFAPEQSLDHYLSHVVLGITQISIIAVPLWREGRRGTRQEATE